MPVEQVLFNANQYVIMANFPLFIGIENSELFFCSMFKSFITDDFFFFSFCLQIDEILLGKTENFDELMAVAAEERYVEDAKEKI